MALEEAGVPSVAVHTHVFARLAQSVARANGMPRARQAYVPQPVVDKSPDELRAYIEGTDPISRRPFMQEIIEGLTKSLDEEDLKGLSFERTTPRLALSDRAASMCSSTRHAPTIIRASPASPRARTSPRRHRP